MTWLAVIGVGLGSYLLRVIPLVVLPRVSVPASFDRVVRHAGLAAITALLVASVRGQAASGELAPTLLAVAIATVLAIRGATMLNVVVSGGVVYLAVLLAASATG
jgi:branched-subunit amino acid transport protein